MGQFHGNGITANMEVDHVFGEVGGESAAGSFVLTRVVESN
jgi:hypothetical protein